MSVEKLVELLVELLTNDMKIFFSTLQADYPTLCGLGKWFQATIASITLSLKESFA
jgi:hypothetical protein